MPMRPAEMRLPAANGIRTQPAAKMKYGIGTSSRRFQSSASMIVQTIAKQMWTRKRSSWRSSTGPVKAFQMMTRGQPEAASPAARLRVGLGEEVAGLPLQVEHEEHLGRRQHRDRQHRRQRPSRSPQAIQMSAGASARPTGRVSTPSAPSTDAQKKRFRSASRNVPVASTRKRLSA